MNSRERIIRAINHQPHDRIPIDIGATFATGFTAVPYAKVRAELGISPKPVRVVEPMMMLAEVEMPVIKALGIDTIGLYLEGGHCYGWKGWTIQDGTEVMLSRDIELRKRSNGGWEQFQKGAHKFTMLPDSYYFDPIEYPKWRNYYPSDLTNEVLRDIEKRARYCHENTDLAVILNVPYTIFNGTSPDFLCALILEKDEVHERLEIWTNNVLQCLSKLVDAVKDYVIVMAFSGDAGSQKGPLIGPNLYREMILPHFRKIPEYLHKHSDIKFFYHTCGSVYKLIDCFIELGVDILNPLQVSAAEMEPERLVKKFGDRIVFWGGGCDSQHVLPDGTEDDVRKEVRSRLEHYAGVRGFAFSQVHNIQPDVPVRNILSMVEEVKKWKINPVQNSW